MRIKATGTVLENLNDGVTVKVAWDPHFEPREWYFYTYRTTIIRADIEISEGRRLVDFTFGDAPQDYAWWLARPYWAAKYETVSVLDNVENPQYATPAANIDVDDEAESSYTVDDIVADGCFLGRDELVAILERCRSKRNLVLQGPPGTGKTWLAKRLGFALAGSNDR